MFKPGPLPPEAFGVETWNILFQGWVEARHAWDRLSPPHCRHVICYGYAARADAWLFVQPAWLGCAVQLASEAERHKLEALYAPHATALLARPRGDLAPARPRLLTTCASVVAGVIGFPSSALRPIDLYRDLVADRETEVIDGLQPPRHARVAAEGQAGRRPSPG